MADDAITRGDIGGLGSPLYSSGGFTLSLIRKLMLMMTKVNLTRNFESNVLSKDRWQPAKHEFMLGTASKPNRRLPGGSVRFLLF